ncbi:hypothetical protein GOD80_15375 [Sinorhizobium medicae]|nr:hypothetical protein [Sinorhizobium medicae]MDX0806575.1 hypothetical protein [Sinorhizobium medicae]RVQ72875.1 hypothetical protein CN244_11745 [Sinorhizobium medicae]
MDAEDFGGLLDAMHGLDTDLITQIVETRFHDDVFPENCWSWGETSVATDQGILAGGDIKIFPRT